MWSLSCCKGRANSSDCTEAVDELDGAVSATTGLGSKEEQKASERHLSLSDYTPRPRSSSTSEIEKSRRETKVNYTSRNELENQVSLASSQIQVISNPGALDISEPAHRTLPSSLHSQPQDYGANLQALVCKMEETEQQRQKQHNEMINTMKDNFEKLFKVIQDSKERRISTTNSMKSEKSFDFGPDFSASVLLPKHAPVTDRVILRLSGLVTSKWKFLARELEIEEHEIQKIARDNQGDVHEQSYQMLLKWTQSNGGGSYQALGEALRSTFGEKLYLKYVRIVSDTEEEKPVLTLLTQPFSL